MHLSNARLSNNAQSALDSMGQHLMTTTHAGVIAWATPQTYALLAKARVSDDWQQSEMALQVRLWLAHEPAVGNVLKLTGLDYPLALKMMGLTEQKEVLLKLEDGNKPTGPTLLKLELGLTDRESEVLHWIANGKTNREVAEILEMSPRTVNKHLEQIFPKLGVENRTSAAGVALRVLAMDH